MDRVFKVNDTLLFATGTSTIWKFTQKTPPVNQSISNLNCYPNPANKKLTIALSLNRSTHVLINLFDEKGTSIKSIMNAVKQGGDYKIDLDIGNLNTGIYYLFVKTHEDHKTVKILVTR